MDDARTAMRAVFGGGYCVVLASCAAVGAGCLAAVAGFSGATYALTSDFVALHFADAFRLPAYVVAAYCGAEIAHGADGAPIAPKVAAQCAALVVALTGFGIAVVAVQTMRGESWMHLGLLAYAVYVDFGWHVLLIGTLSMVGQVGLRDVFEEKAVSGKWLGMSMVVSVLLVAWAADVPFGPSPAPYSAMNGYGHQLGRFFAAGVCWTAFGVLVVLSAHARSRSSVNVAVPALAMWMAAILWISANEAEPQAFAERREELERQPGIPHVVAWDIEVQIDPVERRLRSRGSALLANVGAESMRDLALLAPRGAQLRRIVIPNTSAAERGPAFHRYVFGRPLRSGERVKMRFELILEERGPGGETARLVENGTFLESGDVVPLFGKSRSLEVLEVPAARVRMVIGTSLDQVAIGPGALLREWRENARRYFEYARSPHVARPGSAGGSSFSIHSGRYAVARGNWNDTAIEIFQNRDRERHVDAILQCVGESLESRTQGASPYPDAMLRIVEYPYAGEARIAPDAILFSERREFAFDLGADASIDALCEGVDWSIARQL